MSDRDGSGIAIVGIACRFPGAGSPDQFWRNLREGVESVTFFSDQQLLEAGVDLQLLERPDYVKASPILDGFDQFDAPFFALSPREAAIMDPQHRLFLQVSWAALEDAGYAPDASGQVVGVFAGAGSVVTSYLLAHQGHADLPGETAGLVHITNDKDFLSTRVSFKLNLTGPSVTVQTACSTSLVAVHLACQSLLAMESDMALTGAATLRVPHVSGYIAEPGSVHSKDGRCRSFDAAGKGTIFGSGVAALVLKRVADARADGDRIYAVIKGSAINNDGSQKVSYTAPSVTGQARAMVEALTVAEVEPDSVDYVECHATGTPVGDPLEIQALTRAFRTQSSRSGFCAVGSVKTNIGHAEQTAGLAGLIKTALALHHGEIPPTLHFDTPNPDIDFATSPFFVNDTLRPWRSNGRPRRAAVNSLGIGGTNAFVVLEEAPAAAPAAIEEAERPCHLFCLSARTETALRTWADRFSEHLDGDTPPRLADLCHTTNRSRTRFQHRLALVAEDPSDLQRRLEEVASGRGSVASVGRDEPPRLVFLFSGQGAQYPGMAAEIYRSQPVFRKVLDQCDEILRGRIEPGLVEVLLADGESDERIQQTELTQPLLFSVEYALAALWQSLGVRPATVLGHSLGELTAACVAGALELAPALRFVAARAAAMARAPGDGAMAALFASADEVREVVEQSSGRLSVASFNSPENTVLSGDREALEAALETLRKSGLRAKRLAVSHAFHSALMEPALPAIRAAARELGAREPEIPVISNVTGEPMVDAPTPDYWCEHVRRPVRFANGIGALARMGHSRFLEVGPGSSLLILGQQCLPQSEGSWLPSLAGGRSERRSMLETLGDLYRIGVEIEWDRLDEGFARRRVSLPTYPFEERRYWLESPRNASPPAAPRPDERPSTDCRIVTPRALGEAESHFEISLTHERFPYLGDHHVYEQPVLPTALLLESVLEAGHLHFGGRPGTVEGFLYHQALIVPPAGITARIVLRSAASGSAEFQIESRNGESEPWRGHAEGVLRVSGGEIRDAPGPSVDEIRSGCPTEMAGEAFYAAAGRAGLGYGPRFRGVQRVWLGDGELVSRVEIPSQAGSDALRLHPTLVDSCLHTYLLLTEADRPPTPLPIGVERFAVHRPRVSEAWVHAVLRDGAQPGETRTVDLRVLDERSRLVAEMRGLAVRRLPPEAFTSTAAKTSASDRAVYRLGWKRCPAPVSDRLSEPAGCLIFADEGTLGQALAARMRRAGHDCHLARRAESFGQGPDREWRVRPGEPADFERLTEAVTAAGRPLRWVVHLWSLDAGASEDMEADALDAAVELGTRSALHAAQALSSLEPAARLWLVTRGAQTVSASRGPVAVCQAPLWGLGRTVALEHPLAWGGLLDLDPGASESAEDEAGAILNEVLGSDGEDQVALRPEGRHVARLSRFPPHSGSTDRHSYRPDATYLITGGLGMLGLETAKWLTRRKGVRFLVLSGRTPPDTGQARTLRQLEAAGVRVEFVQADVAEEADLRRLLRHIEQSMPELAGVFHCAGVIADRIVQGLDWRMFTAVLRAKARGAWLLHRHTTALELDLFVVHSSMLSLTGSAGQANYTAANAFLDALVDHRRRLGLPATGINWGPWAGSGMAAASGKRGAAGWQSRGISYLPPELAIGALDDLLDRGAEHAAVFIADWSKRLGHSSDRPLYEELSSDDWRDTETSLPSPSPRPAPADIDSSPGKGPDAVLATLCRHAQEILGFDEGIDRQRPLNELGLDSLMAVKLSNSIKDSLGVTVPIVRLIRGPSLAELAGELATGAAALADPPPAPFEPRPERPERPEPASRAAPAAPAASRDSRIEGGGWLLVPRPNVAARARLFCFPFSGGSAATYRPWAESLDASIELVCIEPPGRATRVDEQPIHRMEEFIEALVPRLRPWLDKPYGFFGYCLGAMTLYQTVKSLGAAERSRLRHAFVSGARAPHRAADLGPFEERLLSGLVREDAFDPLLPFHEQPDEIFAAILRHFNIGATEEFLAEDDLRAALLPAIRADFEMAHRHHPVRDAQWDVPITCFVAVDDPYVSREDALAWSEYTAREFRIHFRAGSHFLIDEDRHFLVDAVGAALAGAAEAPDLEPSAPDPPETHEEPRHDRQES